ncbi:LemA family protein [Limosilactobacillus reuteri]|uniref:LemA family protein n=1 Tax=Limosilactobacillus reuteri TaxID=1598 RepID=UPI001E37235F|nr:LemA family protein [Limosilactobacillus reuteri]MCC4456063.1 LemA family protein [Limosilactobacillus reuteri]MCC4464996.1 LemA family protein [Limosilactobacillus reuteri]
MTKRNKIIIWLSSILTVFIIGLVSCIGVSNGQIRRQQEVQTAKANISKEEQRRVDLFRNMVDAVQSYNKYERSTQEKITDARAKANAGKIREASQSLNAVVERYPELKSQGNYKQAMLEFSVTENRLANYRENYNDEVQSYNVYVRRFPNHQILNMLGNDTKTYQPLNYDVNNAKATNLFK